MSKKFDQLIRDLKDLSNALDAKSSNQQHQEGEDAKAEAAVVESGQLGPSPRFVRRAD